METVKLAEDFMLSSDGVVVGLDLSGDPTVSTAAWLDSLNSLFNTLAHIYQTCIETSTDLMAQHDIRTNLRLIQNERWFEHKLICFSCVDDSSLPTGSLFTYHIHMPRLNLPSHTAHLHKTHLNWCRRYKSHQSKERIEQATQELRKGAFVRGCCI